ncbi:MAG: SxtJ family membrane protein [Candidatus Omnitrophota bacterium]
MEKLKLDKDNLRKFGIIMGIAFMVITVIILIRHKHNLIPTAIVSAIFLISAFTAPLLLKPVYLGWMRFAFILSWINTRVILFIMFYLIFAPVGIIMRILRIDLLRRKIDKDKDSYWQDADKKPFNRADYDRQF